MIPLDFFINRRNRRIFVTVIEDDAKDHFTSLPDELILKILKFLSQVSIGNCATVCKKFSRLVKDESLWKEIDVLGKSLTPTSTTEILSRKPMYLRMASATIEEPMGLPNGFGSPQLYYLDLTMAHVTSTILTKILLFSTSLIKCSFEALEISTDGLEALMQSRATLNTLNFTLCTIMDAEGLSTLLTRSTKLRALNLGCIQHHWSQEELLSVIRSLPISVTELNLSGFRNLMNDRHVGFLVESVPNVTDLDLSDAQLLTDATVTYIQRHLYYIEHLAFSRCYHIQPSAYMLLYNCHTLQHLEIFSLFREQTLQQIAQGLPGIIINECPFSSVARPTIANQRNSIWGHRIKYYYN